MVAVVVAFVVVMIVMVMAFMVAMVVMVMTLMVAVVVAFVGIVLMVVGMGHTPARRGREVDLRAPGCRGQSQ